MPQQLNLTFQGSDMHGCYEYKAVVLTGDSLIELTQQLNELGQVGWRLVAVVDSYRYIFIRPPEKPDEDIHARNSHYD